MSKKEDNIIELLNTLNSQEKRGFGKINISVVVQSVMAAAIIGFYVSFSSFTKNDIIQQNGIIQLQTDLKELSIALEQIDTKVQSITSLKPIIYGNREILDDRTGFLNESRENDQNMQLELKVLENRINNLENKIK